MTDLQRELAACPFCGGSAEYKHGHLSDVDYVACQNDGCAALGPTGADKIDAIALWNRRQHHAAIAEAVRGAERYRWLRHGDNDESVIRGPVKDGAYLLRNDKLDAAIDAAMAAEGRE